MSEDYNEIAQQTDELVKSTMMRELRSMKQTNDRLMKVIAFLASVCFGGVSWYAKNISDKIEKFVLSTNTLEIHQGVLDRNIEKLEKRFDALEAKVDQLGKWN